MGSDLLEVYREWLQEGYLKAGMDQGLITLLHKKAVRENLKNWEPMTFLNFDHKLMAIVFVVCFKSVTSAMIHEEVMHSTRVTDPQSLATAAGHAVVPMGERAEHSHVEP